MREVVMTETAAEQDDENPRELRKVHAEKLLKRMLFVCSLLLGGELVWLFIVNPCMPFSSIEINDVPGLDRITLLETAGITSNSSFLSVNAKAVEAALQAFSEIESVKVTKRFPDSLNIYIIPRRAVSMMLAEFDGKTVPLYFDKNGVVFKLGGSDEVMEKVPIISGIKFSHIEKGAKLPAELSPFLGELENIRVSSPELLEAVSEITINKKPYDGYDLIMYPVFDKVKIRLNSDITDSTLRYMLLLIDVLSERGVDVDTVDFRRGTASYTVKDGTKNTFAFFDNERFDILDWEARSNG